LLKVVLTGIPLATATASANVPTLRVWIPLAEASELASGVDSGGLAGSKEGREYVTVTDALTLVGARENSGTARGPE
jgi:hypothetical protein